MSLLEALTLQQKETLEEFKGKMFGEVPCHLQNDVYLYLRFLRARDFNLKLAESMLRNHLSWRKATNLDNILTKFKIPEIALKYIPLSRIGFDKDGSPVRYFDFGNMDGKGILKSAKKNEVIKSVLRYIEEDVPIMKDQTEKLGKPVEQWVYILNFENFTFARASHKPLLEALVSLFMQYEANYPERLKAAYVINASIYFTITFSVIKPMLSGATIKKISIFGKDGWKEELLKVVDPEVLPAYFGGKKTDPDGNIMCKTFIKYGEMVPEDYYMTKSLIRLSSQPGVSKITVPRMAKINLNLDVKEPGSLIEWQFETVGKDIGFGLLYKNSPNDETAKSLVPNQRFNTEMATEIGMYQCDWPGTYVLVFNNSYSWIHQKEIYYKATVVHTNDINSDEYD